MADPPKVATAAPPPPPQPISATSTLLLEKALEAAGDQVSVAQAPLANVGKTTPPPDQQRIAENASPEERAQALLEKAQELIEQARSEIQTSKEKLAEFNFQTITVILGVLTLVAAIPLVVLHNETIASGTIALLILVFLAADTVLAVLWMTIWLRLNVFAGRNPEIQKGIAPKR